VELPNRTKAIVKDKKLYNFLLSETHPKGASRAKLLNIWGFNNDNANKLRQELLKIAKTQDVVNSSRNAYRTNYVIDGTINTPQGENKRIRTVWSIAQNKTTPSFTTLTFK
jgi:hypothetical protein